MQIELINTGSELLIGQVANTHQHWICSLLANRGYRVSRQMTVPDTAPAIQGAIGEALARADLVIATGGLGPTSDDRTREWVAQLLGSRLVLDEAVLAQIRSFFTQRKRMAPGRTEVQAMVPEGALVLTNRHGTAPGLAIEVPAGRFRAASRNAWLVLLPGPPRELYPMFHEQVLPWLGRTFPLPHPFTCRVLRTTGMGESMVEDRLEEAFRPYLEEGLELGFCARPGEVDIRLAATGTSAGPLVAKAEETARALLKGIIFGADDERLERTVVQLLTQRGQTVSLAESCTGGGIANRLTNVPGASAVLTAGLVVYCNQAKVDLLGVSAPVLQEHGAVSEPVAREMAQGARLRARSDFALAVTGIAGPSGGSEEKPVGTVYIALAAAGGTRARRFFNPYDRETFKYVTGQQAMEMLRRELVG